MGNKRFRLIFSIFAFFSWLVAVPDSAETRLKAVHGQRWVNKNVITYSYDILLYIYLQNITLPTIQEIYDTIYLKWYEDTVKYMCNMILSTYKPQYNIYLYLCRILLRESVTRQADHIPGQRCPGQHCMSQNFSEHPYFYKNSIIWPRNQIYTFAYYLFIV